MAVFPALKTGAFSQYPSDRTKQFATHVHEFVDGREQRSPVFKSPLRKWVIRLELLDEAELFELEQFFVEQAGGVGEFSFIDPWDGTEYERCSFEGEDIELVFAAAGDGRAEVVIRENR